MGSLFVFLNNALVATGVSCLDADLRRVVLDHAKLRVVETRMGSRDFFEFRVEKFVSTNRFLKISN